MPDRREFIATGVLAAASCLWNGALSALANPASASLLPQLLVADFRFVQARRWAAAISGVAVASFEGDLLPLWTTRLRPLWQQQPMAVAGLTTRSDLFVLEIFAADYRMKLLHSEAVEHVEAGDALYQWMIVPRSRSV